MAYTEAPPGRFSLSEEHHISARYKGVLQAWQATFPETENISVMQGNSDVSVGRSSRGIKKDSFTVLVEDLFHTGFGSKQLHS